MSDMIDCPNCGEEYSIGELELWQVYNEDGAETEFDCVSCEKPLIITSHVTGWSFEVEVNE